MQANTHKALVLKELGKAPTWEDYPKPVAKEGQLLVKVQGSTVNPSDRGRLYGVYAAIKLPGVPGLEGTGHVVEANGEHLKEWIGKRICFIDAGSGAWGEYALASPEKAFIIDEDVPLVSAASGIVNPLTVIGMTDIFETYEHKKGIIHTAAASALGRMLNKLCKTKGIPLLNIVRKKEHQTLLKSEGAEHVIVTEGDWVVQYQQAIQTHGFNILFDALGGGEVTEKLIVNLNKNSKAFIYGFLEGKPLTITSGLSLSKGITVSGYLVFNWYGDISEAKRNEISAQYSNLLKNELSTTSYKYLKFTEISEALELCVSKATEGKITLTP